MPWGQGPGWGQFGTPGWGGLSVTANPLVDRASVVWCLDLYLEASFPWTFPLNLDALPFRVSTLDLYPGDVLGDVLYEGQILEKPTLKRQTADPFGGIEEVDSLSFKLSASGIGDFANMHDWVTAEHRGKVIIGHLVQLDKNFTADLVMQNVFRGEVLAMGDDPGTVAVAARAFDMASLVDLVPVAFVDTSWAPYAPTGSLGQVVNQGVGIGRRIPCPAVKMRTEDESLIERTFTADFPTDTLNIPFHDFETGDGAYRVTTTGTLPSGLLATVDYWLIAVDEDNIRLATTRANAFTSVAVPFSDNGSGTHTLRAGLSPNFDDDYDCVAGEGNLGIIRVWEDASAQGSSTDAIPDAPFTFNILHRTYKPTGSNRYATAIRFHDSLDGTEITADVLRVYPDVDDAVIAEWKWLLGFHDDVGGIDAIDDPAKNTRTSTADLTATHQGWGLGSVQLASDKGLIVPYVTGANFALQSFTVEVECFPAVGATGSFYPLLQAPQWDISQRSWFLYYDGSAQKLGAVVPFQDGTSWNPTVGTMPRGHPALVAIRRDGSSGKTELWLNGKQVASDTRAAALQYGVTQSNPLGLGCWSKDSANGFKGRLGWVRLSDIYRTNRYLERAAALWRRNGIEWCRELAESVGRPVNATVFDQATADWDAVEVGSLKCDGYLTEPNELRAVLSVMVPFRELRFSINVDGLLEVTVAKSPTAVKAQFGHGDQFANLLSMPSRTRASLTEATQKFLVHFRRPRNGAEPFGGYEREVQRPVFSVGTPGTVLDMPFIDNPVTADIVVDFAAKRRITRDSALDVVVGYEGRELDIGDAFRVNVPEMSIGVDLEAIVIGKGAEQAEIRGVPTNAADFAYTPKPLPADPAERTLRTHDLGNQQSLTATLVNGRVLLTLNLTYAAPLMPTADGTISFPTVVGAASHWQAVTDLSDGTYVRSATGRVALETFHVEDLQSDSGDISGVSISLRMRIPGGGGSGDIIPAMLQTDTNFLYFNTVVLTLTNTTFADFSYVFPAQGTPWTIAQINQMQVGVLVNGGPPIDVARAFLTVTQVVDPIPAGFVRYWMAGPSATLPPVPLEGDAPILTAEDFTPQTIDLPGTPGDKYWFWARIYDEFGRSIALIGPGGPVTI